MYESFYGLNTDPFRLSADHRFCFNHPSYIRAKGSVQYALYRAEGFVMITGRPGTGKTTLVDDLLASLSPKKYVIGHLVSSQLEGAICCAGPPMPSGSMSTSSRRRMCSFACTSSVRAYPGASI
jgi:type II secretory pathway predicted ATPase ExeA